MHQVKLEEAEYEWDQTLADVDIVIHVPKGTRAKSLQVDMSNHDLKIQINVPERKVLLSGPLEKQINLDESTWTVEEQERLVIHLEKSNKMEWWSCVIKGHPSIDIGSIEPENSKLSDLDEETRATVEKMMLEQSQKRTDEQKRKDVLQNFMKQHPELDFSNVRDQI
ncbi:Nuclear movement protein nudc [Schizosaccharomyces pombe]